MERAKLLSPDLILLDVLMPGMDGFETCRRLKASGSTKDIPVIFMTALGETAYKVAGFEAGGVDYVIKPLEIHEVLARIDAHLALYAARAELKAQNVQLRREIEERERLEAALRCAHDKLERRVAERTADLAAANALLKQEIGERRRTEETLRESQGLLRAIIDNSATMVCVKDLQGRYLLFNHRFKQLFDVSVESIVGRTDDDLFPPEQAEMFRSFDRRVLEAQKPLETEVVVPQDDGIHTYISINCPLFDAEGKPYAVCAISTDITERKRAEEERERLLASEQAARSRAETADRLKDEFLCTLSHELRTPLTSILGWAHILLRTDKLDAARVQRALKVIERNSRAELELVETLLDVSAILCGKVDFKPQSVSMVAVVQAILDAVAPAAEAKGVGVSLSLSSTASRVWGDRGRLEQIVTNLLSNAIKFTPSGGRVTVSLEEVGATSRLRISDTGEGISADFLPRVFDRFRQANSSTTRWRSGLGLGLSIVRDLVKMHGGEVRAESAGEGRGAEFIVDLPLMPVVEETAAPPSTDAGETRSVQRGDDLGDPRESGEVHR
ncbi:hybrid sensor histidine kinase/response regulator [Sorangium cellulosum]|uniref:histidine kinase n=1 Tax=Sorangium cellulosum TaxID=56 RepID=A0A150S354_SORCE|nr:hybrid sensor histidine kinase/response regulator [Sorangium cellulosum]